MTLPDLFSWGPGKLQENRRACERVRQAELLLASQLSPAEIVEQGMAACATVVAGFPDREWPPGKAAGPELTAIMVEDFLCRGGDELLAAITCCRLPLTAGGVLHEFRNRGEGSARALLILAEFPDDSGTLRAHAKRTGEKNQHRALAEQIEHLRLIGEDRFLCDPVNREPSDPENLLPCEGPAQAGEIEVASFNYRVPGSPARYRTTELEGFANRYRTEVVATRSRLARRLESLSDDRVWAPQARVLPDQTYGVEIEAFFADWTINAEGMKAVRAGLANVGLSGWIVSNDVTIQRSALPGETVDERCDHLEVISPVMGGREAARDVARALHVLRHLGLAVNQTCGLHPNVGDRDGLDLPQAKSILVNYARNQEVIDAQLPTHRNSWTNENARAPHTRYRHGPGEEIVEERAALERFSADVSAAGSFTELLSTVKPGGKMCAVNLNRWELGYAEFRQSAGTLETPVVWDWLHFCGMLVRGGRIKPMEGVELPADFRLSVRPNVADARDVIETDAAARELEAVSGTLAPNPPG